MANQYRGEVAVEIGGKQYALRPTYEVQAEIEGATGIEMFPLARRIVRGDYGVRTAAVMLLAGINATLPEAERLKPKQVQDALTEKGLVGYHKPLTKFVENCLTGGAEPGEAEAAERS